MSTKEMKIALIAGILFGFCQTGRTAVRDIFPPGQGNDTSLIASYMESARKFYETDDHSYDSTLFYLNQALELSQSVRDPYYTYKLYDFYSKMTYKTGNHYTALEYYFKLLQMLDEKTDAGENPDLKNEYALLYKNIGVCMSAVDIDKSLEYLKKSLLKIDEICRIDSSYANIDEMRLSTYNNIGATWITIANFDSASYYCEKALYNPVKIDNPAFYASLYNNLGIINWELGNPDTSFDFYRKSLAIREQSGDKAGIADIHYNLGLCYLFQKKISKALFEIKTAFDMCSKINNIRGKLYSVEVLAQIYEEQKNYPKAMQMLRLFVTLKDSIAEVNRANEISRIELQYSLEKQLRENELQQQITIAKKERKTLITVSIAVFLLFSLLILLLLYRNQRIKNKKNFLEQQSLALQNENLELKNRQLNQRLDYKNKELNTQMKFLMDKTRFISSIIDNVSEMKGQDSKQIKSTVKDLKLNIEDTIGSETGLLFQHLHRDFYSKLYERHPDLTPNEKKLSAFIRLNMSSKEISSVTFQSVKSIEIARSRLRKKLNLKRNENLNMYLQSL
jgi:tetratricopeptide (TPR) repeat protein/DNA-binding CsgD family transcriptional regulator